MTIRYTIHEGGELLDLPIKSSHQKLVKQLYKHRNINRYGCFSHVKISSLILPFRVHSVFFMKKNKVVKIWDATLNGYRNKNSTKTRH